MHSLTFSHLDENLFQGILVVSSTPKLSCSDWLKRIIENSLNKSNLEFQPVLENGQIMLRFDTNLSPGSGVRRKSIDPIRCHCAMLDNKYYNTKIYLVELDEPMEFPERFYEFIHGILIYFDNDDENCLKKLDTWTQYIDLMENCAIKILSCENATEKNCVGRIEIQNYCIDKGFELVELAQQIDDSYPNDSDDELEDDGKEANGFERLYKAIQAYVWPNLNYKEKRSSKSNESLAKKIDRLNIEEKTSPNVFQEKEASLNFVDTAQSTVDPPVRSTPENEQDAEKFEELMSKFSDIKEKASQLEDNERKRYAEKVAIAFWNSISDDHDEVLFSSEDDNEGQETDPNHVYI